MGELKQADNDFSKIDENDDDVINMQEHGIKIFRTGQTYDEKLMPEKITYTHGVEAWNKDPQEALKKQGYLDPSNKKFSAPEDYPNVIAVHNFSREVDTYLFKEGRMSLTDSRKKKDKKVLEIRIPGTTLLNNEEQLGVFRYLFKINNAKHDDPRLLEIIMKNPETTIGLCYHRMFEQIRVKQMMSDFYEKGFKRVHFPPLNNRK